MKCLEKKKNFFEIIKSYSNNSVFIYQSGDNNSENYPIFGNKNINEDNNKCIFFI